MIWVQDERTNQAHVKRCLCSFSRSGGWARRIAGQVGERTGCTGDHASCPVRIHPPDPLRANELSPGSAPPP